MKFSNWSLKQKPGMCLQDGRDGEGKVEGRIWEDRTFIDVNWMGQKGCNKEDMIYTYLESNQYISPVIFLVL